jgi:hypothetical protein
LAGRALRRYTHFLQAGANPVELILAEISHRNSLASDHGMLTRKTEGREVEDYSGWSLRERLELLAFDARLAGVPQALLEALWEANRRDEGRVERPQQERPTRPVSQVSAVHGVTRVRYSTQHERL